jgi:hypothetical protein
MNTTSQGKSSSELNSVMMTPACGYLEYAETLAAHVATLKEPTPGAAMAMPRDMDDVTQSSPISVLCGLPAPPARSSKPPPPPPPELALLVPEDRPRGGSIPSIPYSPRRRVLSEAALIIDATVDRCECRQSH